MASITRSTPFLALPLELRLKIYEQLLSPNSERVYTLYHDRHGRDAFSGRHSIGDLTLARSSRVGRRQALRDRDAIIQSTALPTVAVSRITLCNIDPNILQVSQQIYSEAASILYGNNKFMIYLATPVCQQCTGGNYSDGIGDPADLFRTDTNALVEMADRANVSSPQSSIEESESREQPQRPKAGIIYPHCFRRLRHIEIVTARHAIWGDCEGGPYFSHIGRTIWKILKVLADEQATENPLRKHLKLTIEEHWLRYGDGCQGRQYEMDYNTKSILGMMKALQRRTDVEIEVEEEMFIKSLREMRMEEVEVDKWEEALLADMTDTIEDFAPAESDDEVLYH